MTTILHLSDLHFGEVIEPPNRDAGLLNHDDGAKKLAKTIFNRINSEDNNGFSPPESVLVTGDLTSKALAHEFNMTEIFLQELSVLLEIEKSNILVIPGNHDISWNAEKSENSHRYSAYNGFYKSFYGTEWSSVKPVKMTVDIPGTDEQILIFGFNSCSVERSTWRGLGYISEDQLDDAEKWLSSTDHEKYRVRIAALHHHVLPVHNYHPYYKDFDPLKEPEDIKNPPPVSLLLNASQLLKRCRKMRISGILHGHAHTPYSVRQTNFIDIDAKDNGHTSRSMAIIGIGTPSSEDLKNYHHKCFQLIQINYHTNPAFFHLRCFNTLSEQRTIGETTQSNIIMPGGHDVFEIPSESVSQLRTTLNNTILKEQDLSTDIIAGEDIEKKFDYLSLNDSLLSSVLNWLDAHRGRSFGNAYIARYMKDLNAYKVIAIHRYDKEVRHIVYLLDETSITMKCAQTNRVQNIESRANCSFASSKRNNIYQRTLGGEDQACLAIPLNSMNKRYPYAIIGFARPQINNSGTYSEYDIALIEGIKGIIENGIRQAELTDIAEKRRRILHLCNWLKNYIGTKRESDIFDDFELIADKIYRHLGLRSEYKDALAILLPKPPDFKNAYCVVERGFGRVKANGMSYKYGKNEGLTGRILDTREYDYCLDHLNKNETRLSIRKQKSSGKCEKAPVRMADTHISFIGVPLGGTNVDYNKGALILNITIPIGQGGANYMESNYVEPLQIISQFLSPLIEGPWRDHCKKEKQKNKKKDKQKKSKKK